MNLGNFPKADFLEPQPLDDGTKYHGILFGTSCVYLPICPGLYDNKCIFGNTL